VKLLPLYLYAYSPEHFPISAAFPLTIPLGYRVLIHDREEQGKQLFLWAELRRAQAGSPVSVRFHGSNR
jgi:hypothetical protein